MTSSPCCRPASTPSARTGRTDGFGTENLNEGFVVNGSALTQGMLNQVQDAQGHYPWAVAVGRRKANLFLTGTGSQQYRQIRRAVAGDVVTALTSTQKSRRERGGRIWGGINFDMTKPSFTLTAGFAGGHNLFGAPNENTETIDAMSWADKAAFLRGGGNGLVARAFTDVDVQDIAYYIKMNARRGLVDSSIDVVGHAAPVTPGVPPDPPPTPPVLRMVAATVSYSLEEVVVDPPDPPEPDPELPPPGTDDLDPGIWTQLVVPTRIVYQPRMAGSQSIPEGDPGCAVNVSPNPVSATGTIFRSFSGMAAGGGRVWSIGGGASGPPGNCLDILDLESKRWTLPFQSECPEPYIAGVPNSIWRGIRGGGIATGGFSTRGARGCITRIASCAWTPPATGSCSCRATGSAAMTRTGCGRSSRAGAARSTSRCSTRPARRCMTPSATPSGASRAIPSTGSRAGSSNTTSPPIPGGGCRIGPRWRRVVLRSKYIRRAMSRRPAKPS